MFKHEILIDYSSDKIVKTHVFKLTDKKKISPFPWKFIWNLERWLHVLYTRDCSINSTYTLLLWFKVVINYQISDEKSII